VTGLIFVDGRWRGGAGENFASIDPATGAKVWEGAAASDADAAEAVAAARRAFADWSRRPRQDRIDAVKRYQAALNARAGDFARAISRETGKPLWESRQELGSMQGKVDISIRAYAERTGERDAVMAFGRAVLRHKPHGVAAVLGPYNFPGHLPNGHIVPALLAGDTIVFKPSEETPLSGQMMVECLEAADLPAGVVSLLQGAQPTGQALLDQPIDALLFTGSAGAGAFFRRKFADNPHIILALELGGNNPLVIWDAADIEAAAGHVVQSAYVTTGQRCACARRLIVREGAAGDALVEAIAALSDRLMVGAWDSDPEPFMGPLVSERAAERALQQAALHARAARIVRPFERIEAPTRAWVRPGLFEMTGAEHTPDEEIFAPLIQVWRVGSFDEAVTLANNTGFGLTAGLISDDAALWADFVQRSHAGVVNWNRPTVGAAGDMPFGGLGASGNHRPSAYYAADYCAYPVASFEADRVRSILSEIKGLRS
jgi:succinylglutamic semialdehyde dehydrogenase